jgi:hypothetical protein
MYQDPLLSSSNDRTKKVRLIPYVAVPRMDLNSRIFRKAQATIAKQAAAASVSGTTERKAYFDRLFHLQQGTFIFLYFVCLFLSSLHRYTNQYRRRFGP